MFLAALLACAPDGPNSFHILTQNVGTTPWMDVVDEAPGVREVCEAAYDNNLCTVETEAWVHGLLAARRPAVVLLQEVWDQRWCDEEGRAPAVDAPPYACSADGPQPERILPEPWSWACATGYPDNCVGFDPRVFAVDGPCDGRDCSGAMEDLVAPCGPPGRIAALRGRLDGAAAVVVVIHLSAGATAGDRDCRAEQVATLSAWIDDTPVVLAGGDLNMDPDQAQGTDVDALADLLASHDLARPARFDSTHSITGLQLDHLVVRGLEVGGCGHVTVDRQATPRMLDHDAVTCGARVSAL